MSTLKYKIISTDEQYDHYCRILHDLIFEEGNKSEGRNDEIELLTWLIRKWDDEHSTFHKLDPVELIKSLMEDNHMKAKDLAGLLDVTKGYVSEMLNYKKGLSKDVIRKLSERFKVSQEAFNRPYKLNTDAGKEGEDGHAIKSKRKAVYA